MATPNTDAARLAKFMPTIKRVARKVSQGSHVVETEDLIQELALFVIQRSDVPEPGTAKFNVGSFLTRVANMYSWDQRQQHYHTKDEFSYQTADVSRILETVFDHDDWGLVASAEDYDPSDWISEYSDVAWGLGRLKDVERQLLEERYKNGIVFASGTPEYRKLRKVVAKLCNILNFYTRADEHDGPGSRKAMSNSAAMATIANNER